MAFKLWVSDGNTSGNVDIVGSEWSNGFQANTIAVAKNVNTPIRQANLIAIALMSKLGVDDSSLDASSTQVNVENAIETALDTKFKGTFSSEGSGASAKIKFTLPDRPSSDSFTVPFATQSTTLTNTPELIPDGNQLKVKAGGKTSSAITVNYATNSNFANTSGKTNSTDLTNDSWSSWDSSDAMSLTEGKFYYIRWVGRDRNNTTQYILDFPLVYGGGETSGVFTATTASYSNHIITSTSITIFTLEIEKTYVSSVLLTKAKLYRTTLNNVNGQLVVAEIHSQVTGESHRYKTIR